MKKLSVLTLLMLLFATQASAENDVQKEKVVTSSLSFIAGDATITDHYMSDQEYTGPIMGAGMKFGSFYKKSSNLSWDIDLTYLAASYTPYATDVCIGNPARTSFYDVKHLNADYGTYYNWNPIKNLHIKVGGSFDLLMGMILGQPNHINNAVDLDFQTQLKAAAGIQYGWYFKNFGISLQADIAVPFMGLALSSGKFEASYDSFLGDILPGSMNPISFTSFHNLQGFNTEIEADFIFKKTTIFLSMEYNNRWWNMHEVQNYRKYSLTRIGIKLDLVSRNRVNSNNKYF